MAENGRLNKFEDVADSFETIMRAHRGEIFVQITSAEVFIFFLILGLTQYMHCLGKVFLYF